MPGEGEQLPTIEELESKYMGKLVRLMEAGGPYPNPSARGVVTALSDRSSFEFKVQLDHRHTWWYVDRDGSYFHLEIYEG